MKSPESNDQSAARLKTTKDSPGAKSCAGSQGPSAGLVKAAGAESARPPPDGPRRPVGPDQGRVTSPVLPLPPARCVLTKAISPWVLRRWGNGSVGETRISGDRFAELLLRAAAASPSPPPPSDALIDPNTTARRRGEAARPRLIHWRRSCGAPAVCVCPNHLAAQLVRPVDAAVQHEHVSRPRPGWRPIAWAAPPDRWEDMR